MTDPIGRQTSYTRDSAGYVTVETLPDTNTKQYAYHATYHGVTSFTNERGHVTSYTYDSANGHLLTVSQSVTDVYATTATETTTYTYCRFTLVTFAGILDLRQHRHVGVAHRQEQRQNELFL